MTLQERLRDNVFTHSRALYTQAADRLDALERENAALRKDAERYRYLRWHGFGKAIMAEHEELDAAIDAAMEQR